MSAQLLICKFAFYTHFYFIFTDDSRDLHGSLAHSLSRPTLDCFQIKRHVFISLCLILLLFFKIT